MKKLLCSIVIAAALVLPTLASTEIYLSLGPIKGDAVETAHKDWITVYGIENCPVKSGSTGPVVLTKIIDKASMPILDACSKGVETPVAVLEVVKDGKTAYKLQMKDVVIAQVAQQYDRAKSADLMEVVTLSYTMPAYEYTYTADGKDVTDRVIIGGKR